ncbi:DUF6404 family protein [Pannonibacter carbonis]|uniref:DUF6404 family protein n=1 Tax=Pannonibacter carbonis TaxID=2067569 RepID=UPI001300AA76|nr:DUF6404 family protein [Pannonibacter carbonis]
MRADFAKQCELANQDAIAHGIRPWEANPPIDRLLRKLGLRMRPPLYRSFGANMFVYGSYYGTCLGLFNWFAIWPRDSMPIPVAVMISIAAGLAFGAIVAALVVRKRRKAGLTRWNDLPV